MKKITAFLLCVFMAVSNVSAAVNFTDLGDSHWAYPVVLTLVERGTVRGYEDGSFKPENTVTRAEFATMMGKGTMESSYTDIEGHWAYDVIITSEIPEADKGIFSPDTAITRGDAIEALWKRNGSAEATAVPDFIKQNGDAAAWAYSYGIMTGDDGIDLRLKDTITRAEAAALIVRTESAAEEKGFAAAVPEVTCEIVFNASHAIEAAYSANANITYKELAHAVVLLAKSQLKSDYENLTAKKLYESDYAKDMYVLGYYALGEDIINLEQESKLVTIKDAKTALEKIVIAIRTLGQSEMKLNLYPNTDESKAITHREFAAFLIQIDETIGLDLSYSIVSDATVFDLNNEKMKKFALPAYAEQYKSVLEEVPNEAYDEDLSALKKKPIDNYYFAAAFAPLFMNQCSKLANQAKKAYGTDMKITYYPSICYDNGNGFTMVLKITILNDITYTAEDLFGETVITAPGGVLKTGSEFFVRISTSGYGINE